MMPHLNYIMKCYKYIQKNTKNMYMLKQKRWTQNMILIIKHLAHMIILMVRKEEAGKKIRKKNFKKVQESKY